MNNNKTLMMVVGTTALIFGSLALANSDNMNPDATLKQQGTSAVSTSDESALATNSEADKAALIYLIEEEKLAYNVYQEMYKQYGARTFGNILESEVTHQERVLELLAERNIDDPRTNAAGVFSDQELQELYDSLIEKGSQSLKDALEVGVAIEEKDIADLTELINSTNDQEIRLVAESLRSASENHLRAFSRALEG